MSALCKNLVLTPHLIFIIDYKEIKYEFIAMLLYSAVGLHIKNLLHYPVFFTVKGLAAKCQVFTVNSTFYSVNIQSVYFLFFCFASEYSYTFEVPMLYVFFKISRTESTFKVKTEINSLCTRVEKS